MTHVVPSMRHMLRRMTDKTLVMSVMGAGCIVAEGKPADVISLPTVRQLYFGEAASA